MSGVEAERLSTAADFFSGGGEMGERVRAFDWSKTPVGPIESWPGSLKTALGICLGSRYPIVMWWGQTELIQFYNDAYIPILGNAKHPASLGQSARECWSEIWHIIQPMLDGVFATGEATWSEDFLFFINRNLPREEGYFTFSYSALPDDNGAVTGIFCAVTETTGRMIGERQLQTLRDLGRTVMTASTAEEACALAANTLAADTADIPFALIYLLDSDQGQARSDERQARLAASMGLEAGSVAAPRVIELNRQAQASWPLDRVLETGGPQLLSDLPARFGPLPGGPWPESSRSALLLPISAPGQSRPAGFVVAGLSPRRIFDADYRGFCDLVAGHVATAVSNARAHEEERRQAEALAEIDRAKTAFFSNVSHEFRTPLTLMLGPLEGLLSKESALCPEDRDQVETAHRNSLRLLKLVNSLLDFWRIEAGRINAPTDLAALTADLASQFRSAMQAAGLDLVVDCKPLPEPAYVDRDMWEKIVLNLLSNAFKFTFEGSVTVRIGALDNTAVLTVADTGTGIPEPELPHIFERFHRVEGAKGRTYERTGIGLALIQELVKLHGGTIEAESRVGTGSTFTVRIPLGRAHIGEGRIAAAAAGVSTAVRSEALTGEAMTWLGRDLTPTRDGLSILEESKKAGSQKREMRARVLIADDNADMRGHLNRILGADYDIDPVANGAEAIAAIRKRQPDIVVADVMMPVLDGFGLLRELRADEKLREIPVILVSARAGEEARTEGIGAGADDYLTKPFSAKELAARVATALNLQRVRREARDALNAMNAELSREVTATKQVEDALRKSEDDLRRANLDLEQFAYSASHDLQEPLRTVTVYSEILAARYRESLSGDGLKFLEFLGAAASRMGTLVRDLLTYTHSTRLEKPATPEDAGEALRVALANLAASIEASGARITFDPMPALRVHATHLQQLFQNLIGNAIKYRRFEAAPIVHIAARRDNEFWLFSVSDNGMGIEPEFKEHIFGLFKRLHTREEYSGTGIGLALCQRIVERYHGRIWVESEPGKGSIFYFTLPA